MTAWELEFILAQSREIKLEVLEDLIKKGSFGAYFEFVKVLLDAPITNGGIESEVIDALFKKHSNTGVDAAFARSEEKIMALEKK
jgi:hypothetical protein